MEADKRIKQGKMYLVYLIIIMLQVLSMIYWANVKVNYHIDELFSMGYANSYTQEENAAQHITSKEEWKFNEWIDNAKLKKYLLISDKEEIFNLSLSQAIGKLATSRNYFGLLNLAESLWGYNLVTKWPGILLNIFFLIATELVLIALLAKLKLGECCKMLFLAMFGFCGYTIGLVEFIRFYMLVVLMVISIIFLHSVIWISDKLWQVAVCGIGSLALAYLGIKNSELMVVYAGALMGCFLIALLVTKQWKKLGVYVSMLLAAVIYLACWTDWLDILFHIGYYADTAGQKLGRVTTNIVDMSGEGIVELLVQLVKWLTGIHVQYYFGNKLILILWGILLAWFVLILLRQRMYKTAEIQKRNGSIARHISGSFITWIKTLHFNCENGFVLVLIGTLMIYTLFFAVGLKNMWDPRYYSLGFVTFVIILWYIIDRIMRRMSSRRIGSYGLLIGLTAISCLAPFYTRDVQYIYEQDAELINSLQIYQGMDIILEPYKSLEDRTRTTTAYDCINLMNDETQIYPIDLSEYIYDRGDFPDEFILWTYAKRDIRELITVLENDGYYVEEIATNHASTVYVCNK